MSRRVLLLMVTEDAANVQLAARVNVFEADCVDPETRMALLALSWPEMLTSPNVVPPLMVSVLPVAAPVGHVSGPAAMLELLVISVASATCAPGSVKPLVPARVDADTRMVLADAVVALPISTLPIVDDSMASAAPVKVEPAVKVMLLAPGWVTLARAMRQAVLSLAATDTSTMVVESSSSDTPVMADPVDGHVRVPVTEHERSNTV